jgi:hypothetical protein
VHWRKQSICYQEKRLNKETEQADPPADFQSAVITALGVVAAE